MDKKVIRCLDNNCYLIPQIEIFEDKFQFICKNKHSYEISFDKIDIFIDKIFYAYNSELDTCKNHKSKYILYCKKHEENLCDKCNEEETHKDCYPKIEFKDLESIDTKNISKLINNIEKKNSFFAVVLQRIINMYMDNKMNYILYLNAKRIQDYSGFFQNYFEKGITIKYSNKNLFIKNFNKYDNINELKYEIAEKLMNNCDLKHLKYNNFFFFFTNSILGKNYINYQEEFNLIKNAEDGVLQMYLTEEYEKIKDKELNIDYSTNVILKEAIDYGEQIKTEIIFDKKNNIEKIVNENELIENNYLSDNLENLGSKSSPKEEQFAVLSLLSKIIKEQGVETAVYKESNTDNNDSILQMMCCDYSNKYDLIFDFGEEKNKKILQAETEYENLCANIKKTLSEKLKIDEKDIILSIPKKGSAKISVAFSTPGIYKEEDLEIAIKDNKELNQIKKIHKSLIMEGCKLTTKLLSQEGNNKDPGWGENESRGGYEYIPPLGWIGYGLNVRKKYDGGNDAWLSYQNNVDNQYAVAYYPIRSKHEDSKEMKKLIANLSNLNNMNDDKDTYHNIFANEIDINSPNGEKCGNGIYLYPDIKIAEHNASLIKEWCFI